MDQSSRRIFSTDSNGQSNGRFQGQSNAIFFFQHILMVSPVEDFCVRPINKSVQQKSKRGHSGGRVCPLNGYPLNNPLKRRMKYARCVYSHITRKGISSSSSVISSEIVYNCLFQKKIGRRNRLLVIHERIIKKGSLLFLSRSRLCT